MTLNHGGLSFVISGSKIYLTSVFDDVVVGQQEYCHLAEVQIAGGNSPPDARQFFSSESGKLKYHFHEINGNELVIIQRSELVEVSSYFITYKDTNALRCFTKIKNISNQDITLEHISSLQLFGLGNLYDTKDIYLNRFTNSHHVECQPRRISLFDLGLFRGKSESMKRVAGSNTGSWSCKEELPQAIIENKKRGSFLMFQIESSNSWYWEIGECADSLYLNMGGGNQRHNQWSKRLPPNQEYTTVTVAVCSSDTVNGAINEMTKYRRHIVEKCTADKYLPSIFNEYMHLSWDSPNEQRTEGLVPVIAALGIDYYVIDCGWHNEEPGEKIYPYVGQWKESKARFPKGIKHVIDYIHSYGMKAGLWLEPEVIGYLCEEMLNYYPDDAYFYRNGKPIIARGRRFLDFRCNAVINYLDEVIDKLLGKYGVDYLKFDYNQDCGAGTELNSDSLGDGLEGHAKAYFEWIQSINQRYPNVIIETCSSGGQRMDYKTLSYFPIVSTSDQTDYKKYPYIAGNILSAVLPEQAAVWSYPVETLGYTSHGDSELVNLRVSEEAVAMNMINSFLGRMHLASDISLLNKEKIALIKEGIEFYKQIIEIKKKALPYFPLGFIDFSQKQVAAGFKTENKIYLAVWNLGGPNKAVIPIEQIQSVETAYPKNLKTEFEFNKKELIVAFDQPYQARFFIIETALS